MRTSTLSILISTALSLSSTTAFSAVVSPDLKLAKEQHLVRGNGAEPNTLDPSFVNSGMPGDIIANDMFEGLLIENGEGELVPGQAINWTFSNGGKTITFALREGLTWSNGSPLLASDFVYAWQRGINPKTGNNTGHYFVTANILNADAIQKGTLEPSSLGIKALNDKTLEINLSKSTPYFLSLMGLKNFYPLPQKIIEKHKDNWTRPENIVTNGAYVLKKWVPNELVDVVRNPSYWNNKKTVIEKVTYLGLSSQQAEYTRFQAGEIDMTNRVQLEYYQKLKQESPEQIKAQALLGSYIYSFNTKVAPFDNKKVRRALSMAIDRDILVEKITGQGEPAAYSAVPTTIPNYRSSKLSFNNESMKKRINTAKRLLNEAGYNEDNPLTFTLTYNTSDNHKKIAIAIASMWKPLGVKVTLENMEWKSYVSAKNLGDYQLARSWAFGDYAEPSSILEAFTCEHTANESGFCNSKFDQLMKSAGNTEDESQRYTIYQQAEEILNDASPMIPLYYYNHTRLVRSTLKGFPNNNPKGNIYAKDMFFTK
ncbi:peptide ABC transporter substrate-binding protein [Aliivibrio wodanis]|uniref:peptide ABC transporter substrate-binding protein n=1 Tax=Aliivibrio wodanis TaxID=80852 RepID=UPI00406CBAB6